MLGLFASIFALAIGPLIYQTFGPMKRADKLVSGFILIIIATTIFVEVLPASFDRIGLVAIVLAILGFAGPTLIEHLFSRSANRTHNLTMLLGISGLIIHAAIDGIALQNSSQMPQADSLSIAVILHRIPVGLTVWWLLKPLVGERFALLILLTIAIATLIGYFLSLELVRFSTNDTFSYFQSFISGSLLHVIFHKPHEDGCTHASHTHTQEHKKHHEKRSSIDNSQSQSLFFNRLSKVKDNLPGLWEFFGMGLGLIVLFLIHENAS